jgi:hypothetical protein
MHGARPTRLRLWVVALVTAHGVWSAAATASEPEQSVSSRRTEESFIPSYSAGNLSYLWGSESDLEDVPGAAMSLHEVGVVAQYPLWMTDESRLTAGVRYRYNRLDFSGTNPFATGDLDLHRVQIPVNFWHSFHEQWKLWAGLDPGLFTDFSGLSDDDFALTALAVGAYEFAAAWSVSFGAYYSRDLGEDRLLPVLGVIWRPNPHWNISATFPRLRVAYAPNPDWIFEAMVRPGGSGWNYQNDAANEQLDLEYKSWRATLGVEHFLTDKLPGKLFGYAEAGLGFSQSLKLKRDGDELASSNVSETLTLSAGLRWRF